VKPWADPWAENRGLIVGKLNALKVKGLKEAGRYGDGGGLWLQVRDAEHRSWCFRFTFGGKAREMGLGPVDDVPLAAARDLARDARRLVKSGVDPIARRRDAQAAARATGMTFGEVMDLYIAAHRDGWRNPKHAAQWRTTLDTYGAALKPMAVARVDTGAVMKVIEPIWTVKAETASRVRGRIEAVLDYAGSRGWRAGDNPARWRGHVQNLLPSRAKIARVEHHAALPWAAIGTFMADLAGQSGTGARALAFTILTACRTSEAVNARWSEIDLAGAIWTIPGERMKARREHRVPLSGPALDVLRAMDAERIDKADGFVFPGARANRPLSTAAMSALLDRMGRADITVHGFRSTFRDWCAESTNHPRELAEAALAHTVRDKVEAAYQRGDFFDKRARLMADWATFCGRLSGAGGDVVPMRKSA